HERQFPLPSPRTRKHITESVSANGAKMRRGIRGAGPAPAGVFARGRLIHLVAEVIDRGLQVGQMIHTPAQFLVAIDPLLPEIDIVEHYPIPRIIKRVGRIEHVRATIHRARTPTPGIEATLIITGAGPEAAVKIPQWTLNNRPV